jgi:hypothetical protein
VLALDRNAKVNSTNPNSPSKSKVSTALFNPNLHRTHAKTLIQCEIVSKALHNAPIIGLLLSEGNNDEVQQQIEVSLTAMCKRIDPSYTIDAQSSVSVLYASLGITKPRFKALIEMARCLSKFMQTSPVIKRVMNTIQANPQQKSLVKNALKSLHDETKSFVADWNGHDPAPKTTNVIAAFPEEFKMLVDKCAERDDLAEAIAKPGAHRRAPQQQMKKQSTQDQKTSFSP